MSLLLRLRAALIALAVASLLPSSPASAVEATLRACETRQFPFVTLTVDVTDEDGESIEPPLARGDFACREDDRLQDDRFEVFPPGEGERVRGADVVFVIDASGSMSEQIAAVRDNVTAFVDELEDRGLTSELGIGLGLVRFGGGDGSPVALNEGSLTTNPDVFRGLVAQLTADGGYEPGFRALRTAVSDFDFQPGAQRVFVLISDEDADPGDGNGDHASDVEKQETIDLLLANDVRVFTAVDCAVGFAATDYCDESSVAARTGGMQFAVTDPFVDIVEQIASEIGNAYVLRYRSDRQDTDGKERRVRCTTQLGTDDDEVECTYTPKSSPEIELSVESKILTAQTIKAGPAPMLRVVVTDEVDPPVESVSVFARRSGPGPYVETVMMKTGSATFEAPLPPAGPPGLDFYVRATDGRETTTLPSVDPAGEPFQVAVFPNSGPLIVHNPRNVVVRPGRDVTISASVADQTDFLTGVELRWRNVGDLFFDRVPMTQGGSANAFSATISGARVRPPIEYYIRASDNRGIAATFGTADEPCPDCQVLRGTTVIRQPGTPVLPRR